MEATTLLISDAAGVYLPREFVTSFDLSMFDGISKDDAETCLDPDSEWYWEAWVSILDNATVTIDGDLFHLHQDGDLYALCYERMTDEERDNFGLDD